MSARCWGCVAGVTAVGEATDEPVGACWECQVFGCMGHGERDTGSGKWLCFPSVATAAAASAGLPEVASQTRFDSAEDLRRRFPRVAAAAADRAWSAGDALRALAARRGGQTSGVDGELLGLALGIGRYVIPPFAAHIEGIGPSTSQILPAALLALLGHR